MTHLADYAYLGMGSIVQVNETQPGIQFTLVGIQTGNDPVTGDIYRGLDLFSRVKDLIWAPLGGSSSSSSSSSSSTAGTKISSVSSTGTIDPRRIARGERIWSARATMLASTNCTATMACIGSSWSTAAR